MLGSENNNDDQLRRQFVAFLLVIPAKVVSVDCIHVAGLLIRGKTLTSCDNLKPPFLFQKLFSELRDSSSTIAWTLKSNLKKNAHLKLYGNPQYQTRKTVFKHISKHRENTTRSGVLLTNFEVFGNDCFQTLSRVFYVLC